MSIVNQLFVFIIDDQFLSTPNLIQLQLNHKRNSLENVWRADEKTNVILTSKKLIN